jgi:hypothetical protein
MFILIKILSITKWDNFCFHHCLSFVMMHAIIILESEYIINSFLLLLKIIEVTQLLQKFKI